MIRFDDMARGHLAWVVLLVACGPTLGARGLVTARAREDIPCEQPTRVLQLAEDAFEVDGCGMEVEYTDRSAGGEWDFGRMAPAASVAAYDTHCDHAHLVSVGEREPAQRTFTGCGATATYVLACAEGIGCHWALAGEIIRSDAPPSIIRPVSQGVP